ncbi:putative transcription factor & chromatin remodeling ARID family [Helianthus annuus]|nr:putative transcription factor & chromatin remodeling ARID family [Helianthus annuus]
MVVKRDGGHKNFTSNNLWALVATDMGYDYGDGELMRIMYAMYLDVLVYYYEFKSTQQKVMEKETMKSDEGVSGSRCYFDHHNPAANRRERTRSEGCIPEEEGDHYALFAGNDWHRMKKLQKRCQFDFKQAVKAVDEANKSVLLHSLKHNQV